MARNAEAIGWTAGVGRLDAVGETLGTFGVGDSPEVLEHAAEELHELAVELTSTRLVAPPHPTLVRSRLVDPGAVA
jgi:hypothetical protein